MAASKSPYRRNGQFADGEQPCAHPGCTEPGDYRAPDPDSAIRHSDGPPPWRYLCLAHVREFNAGYNYFAGMSAEDIYAAQHPIQGWDSQRRVYQAGTAVPPAWRDFVDPLDAIAARFPGPSAKNGQSAPRRGDAAAAPLSPADQAALAVLGLGAEADRTAIRKRYLQLVRQYHPDRNGGDRSHEKRLANVISAYTHLRQTAALR